MSSARPPPHPGVDSLEDLSEAVPDPASIFAAIGVSVIQTIVFVYDFITYPIYYCAQTPWKQVQRLRCCFLTEWVVW